MHAAPLMFFCLATLPAIGHAANDERGECSDAPSDAVMILPKPVDQWLTLQCTKFGHILVRHESTNWLNLRSNSFGGLFPAQRPQQPGQKAQENPHGYYFISFESVRLDQATVRPEERELIAMDADVWRFLATTNVGLPMKFYFVRHKEDEQTMAFVNCGPRCGGDFLVAFKR
jgi:hypothetical protein